MIAGKSEWPGWVIPGDDTRRKMLMLRQLDELTPMTEIYYLYGDLEILRTRW